MTDEERHTARLIQDAIDKGMRSVVFDGEVSERAIVANVLRAIAGRIESGLCSGFDIRWTRGKCSVHGHEVITPPRPLETIAASVLDPNRKETP